MPLSGLLPLYNSGIKRWSWASNAVCNFPLAMSRGSSNQLFKSYVLKNQAKGEWEVIETKVYSQVGDEENAHYKVI